MKNVSDVIIAARESELRFNKEMNSPMTKGIKRDRDEDVDENKITKKQKMGDNNGEMLPNGSGTETNVVK